jgi:hypothetical protein
MLSRAQSTTFGQMSVPLAIRAPLLGSITCTAEEARRQVHGGVQEVLLPARAPAVTGLGHERKGVALSRTHCSSVRASRPPTRSTVSVTTEACPCLA